MGEVIVAWNVEGPKTVKIPWEHDQAHLTDLIGNERRVEAESGFLNLEIGPFPIYIRP